MENIIERFLSEPVLCLVYIKVRMELTKVRCYSSVNTSEMKKKITFGFLLFQPRCRSDPFPFLPPKTTALIKRWAWENWPNWRSTTIQILPTTFRRPKKLFVKRGMPNIHWEVISMASGRWRSILPSPCW